MHPEVHLALHDTRAAELRADADAYRLAATAAEDGRPAGLRTRLGWTLVEVGLKLAAPAKNSAPAPA
ncbi:hypothetical protein [Streptomyces sp. NPDC088785]|uniref:hypothetical protein n=1 Tax=Streptomyces sp. NPDC088785 TaxID=3365897 RepID=UPI003805E7A8